MRRPWHWVGPEAGLIRRLLCASHTNALRYLKGEGSFSLSLMPWVVLSALFPHAASPDSVNLTRLPANYVVSLFCFYRNNTKHQSLPQADTVLWSAAAALYVQPHWPSSWMAGALSTACCATWCSLCWRQRQTQARVARAVKQDPAGWTFRR